VTTHLGGPRLASLDIAEGIVMALRRTDPALHSPKWSTSQAITV